MPADRRRIRSNIAYGAALAVTTLVLATSGLADLRLAKVGADDFSRIWAGPRALILGHDPYDAGTWHDTAVRLGTSAPDTAVYLYPPWDALSLAWLATIPLPLASAIWTTAGYVLAIVAVRELLRRSLPDRPVHHATAGVALLASGPAISTLLLGQWDFFLVAALAAMVAALQARRPVMAGLLALPMLAKPQIFLYAAPALALAALWPAESSATTLRGRRFVLVASVGGLILIGASWILIPTWWPAWPMHVGGRQLQLGVTTTIPGVLERWLGPAGLVLALVVFVIAVLVALRFHPRGEAWVPVWLTLSIAAAPYVNPYDLLLLIVPIILAAAALSERSAGRANLVFFGGMALLLVVATVLHDLGLQDYVPLIPAFLFVLVVAALWDVRQQLPSSLAGRGTAFPP